MQIDVLLTLTFAALAAAAGFGVLTWRVLRDERRRAEARIAALRSTIDEEATPPVDPAGLLRARDDEPAPVAAPIFDTSQHARVQGRPVLKVAAGIVMAAGLIVVAAMSGTWSERREASVPAPAGPEPLELVSMRHTTKGRTLTVTGLVRNPGRLATGAVTAVVLAFDRNGDFLASGTAPLEFPTLGPGDESPFVVTVPDAAAAGRYRVSFRTEAGVVRHVDRRTDQPRIRG